MLGVAIQVAEFSPSVIDFFQIVASLAAAASAIFAGIHIYRDTHWRKIARTLSHSPYRNEEFLKAIRQLEHRYQCFEDRKSNQVITGKIDKTLTKDLVLAANYFGQMATELENGLLHENIAKSSLKWRFVKFCSVFEDWLTRDGRHEIYKDTLSLYRRWKG